MIVCLLPARNAQEDLPGWLRGVAGFADHVIALDDGSTDGTRALLEAEALVADVLTNDPRDDYARWDDHANRQRLLDAAGDLEPDWIVFLDADERIDDDDAAALRGFLESGALRGCAYGLRLFRDWGPEGVDPRSTIVHRCFAWQRGLRLPQDRLHFPPVPVSVPAGAWLSTTIRIRHVHSERRAAERVQRYAEADPEERWERGQVDPDDAGMLRVEWSPRPESLPVLAVAEPRADAFFERGASRPTLACLLPVRNGAGDLPGYLDSVARFADAVIALDDGSTDATSDILAAAPMVKAVLSNPPRPGYAGWDDRGNRARLLEEARRRNFDWLLFLDADERIDEQDAPALRELIDRVAEPDAAYGFRVHRMIGADSYDRARLWVYRLFAASAAGELPAGRLHFVPVPESIPRERWRRTTVRIRHLASLDSERREARARKYLEADPDHRFQASYANLVEAPGQPRTWRARPEGFPLLAGATGFAAVPLDLETLAAEGPVLSAVIISRNDADRIERAVAAVLAQETVASFEVIVAASGEDGTADVVRRRFPSVTVIDVPEPGLPGMARNAGLAVARGEYVSFPGSHVELPPGSLQARIETHELGWEMVSGALLNGNTTGPGWASYFLDASSALPGRPSGPLNGPPARCSYAREILDEIGGFPEDVRAGEDTVVNSALAARGYAAYRSSDVRLIHRSPCTTRRRLLAHHFTRGRALGRIVRGSRRPAPSFVPYVLAYPRRRLRDTDTRVKMWGEGLEGEYRRARPLVVAGILAAAGGLAWELFRPRRRRADSVT